MSNAALITRDPVDEAIEAQLEELAPRFSDVLGGSVEIRRFLRTIMIAIERTPKIRECSRQSIFMSAMSAACLGLEADGVTGQSFLIPFKQRAQLVTGYLGLVTLAARGSYAMSGNVVRDGDLMFEFDEPNGIVKHKRKLGNDGRIIAVWASARSNILPPVISVLDIDEVMDVKRRSSGAKKEDSPWNDPKIGFPAMAGKTAKRRLRRNMPMDVRGLEQYVSRGLRQYHQAARMDEAVEEQNVPAWITPDDGLIVDDKAPESPIPETSTNQAPIIDARTGQFRNLPAQIAERADTFMEAISTAGSSDQLEKRRQRASSLLQQIKIVSDEDYDRVIEAYNKKYQSLKEAEEQN